MRYEVYDETGTLFRKFWDKYSAEKFLQDGWKLIIAPKPKKVYPTPEVYGEARW